MFGPDSSVVQVEAVEVQMSASNSNSHLDFTDNSITVNPLLPSVVATIAATQQPDNNLS